MTLIWGPYDDQPASPVDYTDVPLGPGQEDRPVGHVQFTKQGSPLRSDDIRRTPGYDELRVVSRWPERPV